MRTCTRKLEFDYGHRLLNHESKCAHVHGHRGTLEITCSAEALDAAGRVIDFSKIKEVVGGWVDNYLDHAFLANPHDEEIVAFLRKHDQRLFVMPENLAEPSAENIAQLVLVRAKELLLPFGVLLAHVRFYETPNGWAEAP